MAKDRQREICETCGTCPTCGRATEPEPEPVTIVIMPPVVVPRHPYYTMPRPPYITWGSGSVGSTPVTQAFNSSN